MSPDLLPPDTPEIEQDESPPPIPDACAVLAERPELVSDKQAVLALVCEEFLCRRLAGEQIHAATFAARFPAWRTSIRHMVLAEQLVADNQGLLEQVPIHWPAPGETLGDYHLIRELGRGAFARVYLATETSLGGRPVAVKFTRQASAEPHILGRLVHPHIVPVLAASRDQERGFFVVGMRYQGCATLEDVLELLELREAAPPPTQARALVQAVQTMARPGDPAPDDNPSPPDVQGQRFSSLVLQIGAGIAAGLGYLHDRSIIHRDLKPCNVLLTPACTPVLLDFNLSYRGIADEIRIGGTLPYMAPEQIRAFLGEPAATRPGPAADVFSVGVILYELLTGRHPFGPAPEFTDQKELARWLLQRHRIGFRPLTTYGISIDSFRAALVESCLAVDPAARPANGHVLEEGLRRDPRARRYWLLGSLCLVGALGVAGVLARFPSADPEELRPETQLLEDLEKAKTALDQGDEREAASQLKRVEADFARLAKHHLERGNLAGAAGARYGQGRSRMLLGQEFEAQDLLHRAGELEWQAMAQQVAAACGVGPGLGYASPHLLRPHPDGRSKACLAYLRAAEGDHRSAIYRGKQAVEAGLGTGRVLNNLACSRIQESNLPEARSLLEQAVGRHPNLLAPRLNQLVLARRLQMRSELQPAPDSEWCLTAAEQAVRLVDESNPQQATAVYLLAAQVSAAYLLALPPNAAQRPLLQQHVGRWSQEAYRLGVPARMLETAPDLVTVLDLAVQAKREELFPALAGRVEVAPDLTPRLLDPLDHEGP
jgi:serine/threonine protein kinase